MIDTMAMARDYLARQIRLELVPDPPHFHGVDTSTLDVFVRIDDDYPRVGASRYIGVCRLTGRVRDLGTAGE